jgi:hypothetical protein
MGRKIVQDATTEKLCLILSENPDGALYISDELAALFGSMDAYRAKAGKDRPFWLQAKEGAPFTVDRMSRETLRIENAAISVLGGIQPSKMESLSAGLINDGMLQRFFPHHGQTTRRRRRRGARREVLANTETNCCGACRIRAVYCLQIRP